MFSRLFIHFVTLARLSSVHCHCTCTLHTHSDPALLRQPAHPCAGVFADTFTSLAKRGIVPDVLYPAVPVPSSQELQAARDSWPSMVDEGLRSFLQEHTVFLSINRFERKKASCCMQLMPSRLSYRKGGALSTASGKTAT